MLKKQLLIVLFCGWFGLSGLVTDVFFDVADQNTAQMLIGIGNDFEFEGNSIFRIIRDYRGFPGQIKQVINFTSEPIRGISPFKIKINLFPPDAANVPVRHDYPVIVNQYFLFIGLCCVNFYNSQDQSTPEAKEFAAGNTFFTFASQGWAYWLREVLARYPFPEEGFGAQLEQDFSNALLHNAINEFMKFSQYLSSFYEFGLMHGCLSSKARDMTISQTMDKVTAFIMKLAMVFFQARHTIWPTHNIVYMFSLTYRMTCRRYWERLFRLCPVDVDASGQRFVSSFFN